MVHLKYRWGPEKVLFVSESASTTREAISEAVSKKADLRGAHLRGADLRGAKINWQSHDVIAEILRKEAGDDIEKRKIAGLILISRDWCWKRFLAIESSLKEWAIGTLAQHVTDGDNAPEILVDRKSTKATQEPAAEVIA